MVFTHFQSKLYSGLKFIDSLCPDTFITTYCDLVTFSTSGDGTFEYTFSLPTAMGSDIGHCHQYSASVINEPFADSVREYLKMCLTMETLTAISRYL